MPGNKKFSLDTIRYGNQQRQLKRMSSFDNGKALYQISKSGNFPRWRKFGQLECFFRLQSQFSLSSSIGLILLNQQQLCIQIRILRRRFPTVLKLLRFFETKLTLAEMPQQLSQQRPVKDRRFRERRQRAKVKQNRSRYALRDIENIPQIAASTLGKNLDRIDKL